MYPYNEDYVVHLTVPLFLRLLEFAREDSHSDLDLHFVAENVIKLTNPGESLSMKDYKLIVEE